MSRSWESDWAPTGDRHKGGVCVAKEEEAFSESCSSFGVMSGKAGDSNGQTDRLVIVTPRLSLEACRVVCGRQAW